MWSRFNVGKAGTIKWYRDVHARLVELGFNEPIVDELAEAVKGLEQKS